jgi:hypothetical protein
MKQTKISKSARGESCAARVPGVCNFDDATTVLAHAPFVGRYGSRDHWWWSSYLCSSCHDLLDDRTMHKCTNQEKAVIWFSAVHETQEKLIDKGLMEIK